MRALFILIITLIQISGGSIAQARSPSSNRVLSAEELDRLQRSALGNPCLDGYTPNAQADCTRDVSKQPLPNQSQQDQTKKPNNERVSEAALIAKNKKEIIKRCGLEESATTKIIGMKEDDRRNILLNITEERNALAIYWVITYRTDTGNVIFGERQFQKRVCEINKKTGEAVLKDE